MPTQWHTCRCPLIHYNLVHTSGRFRSGTFHETKHESSIESYLSMLTQTCLMSTALKLLSFNTVLEFRWKIRNCQSQVSSAEILFGTFNPEPNPTVVQLLIHGTESPLWSLHQTLGCHSSSSNVSHPTTINNHQKQTIYCKLYTVKMAQQHLLPASCLYDFDWLILNIGSAFHFLDSWGSPKRAFSDINLWSV